MRSQEGCGLCPWGEDRYNRGNNVFYCEIAKEQFCEDEGDKGPCREMRRILVLAEAACDFVKRHPNEVSVRLYGAALDFESCSQ